MADEKTKPDTPAVLSQLTDDQKSQMEKERELQLSKGRRGASPTQELVGQRTPAKTLTEAAASSKSTTSPSTSSNT